MLEVESWMWVRVIGEAWEEGGGEEEERIIER